ncbi:ABC transporter substrate-binding protein [Vineibacter terrae]|uniref:ABC transporter substrate-binding protein n=1 Tax=Vineibacter terrae TaxID=2586908 RepID=A0A5C8PPU6_9HYPH|nr:ABC transporter substrate-binding protein [Vineibacter terrae]TXL77195.1 ABC transporter substrate-binding protein [Vineibacter terrae]
MPAIHRRSLLAGSAAALALAGVARAEDTPGVTATEIRIGSTTSLSGPVSALGVQARCQEAFFRMVNEQGGIAGRKITYIYYDDGFSPPKTVEQVRRLIEEDKVALLFNMLGTAPNSAVVKYINQKKVPHLFLSVNGDKWGDYKTNPWTMGFAPSARIEAQIYAKHALMQKPGARFAILYQNDDLGKDYLAGVRDVLGDRFASQAQAVSYEVTDATVDSQIISLRASNADVLLSGGTAKFVAQSIRKVSDLGWKPMHFIASGATSVAGVIEPVGRERAVDVMSSAYVKDPNDPAWDGDAGIAEYRAFMQKHFPDGNVKDTYNTYAYTVAQVLMRVLRQCEGRLTRENIMHQAANLKDVEVPTLLPGITVNTSPTNYHPLRQVQLMRWNGQTWERFGKIIAGSDV